MNIETSQPLNAQRYARALSASKRVRWDLEADVIRGRRFERSQKFLPDGLSLVAELTFLDAGERRLFGQIQGRTYANMFGLVERYISAKVMELGARHVLGDQVAFESLLRFGAEELKHQELFRRIESLAGEVMEPGYRFVLEPNQVAAAVLAKPSWSVLALTCLIELFTLVHYKESIAPDEELSSLFKDVFHYHWLEESQHAVLDELEWLAEDARIDAAQRDDAVGGLIDLVFAVDSMLQLQAAEDARYFIERSERVLGHGEREAIAGTFLKAYRYQYVFSGVQGTRFVDILRGMIDEAQLQRVVAALARLG